MQMLSDQIGKILLVLAVVIAGAGIYLNPPQSIDEVPQSLLNRPVQVELDKTSLAALGNETFFTQDDGSQYAGVQRAVWVKEKISIVFQPVELDIPPANIMRPPQLLPEPGPSLEGSHKLPRFGDEFAPIVMVDPKTQPKTTTGTPIAPGTAPRPATGTNPK
jgi:hypothetical protein